MSIALSSSFISVIFDSAFSAFGEGFYLVGQCAILVYLVLKRFRVARYNELLMSGELNSYLYKVNEEAQERFESLVADFAESNGLTEELKEKDQMKWVQLANYVANAAKEIVESEVIFR